MNRAVFLDRDGVINKLLPGDFPDFYVTKWEQFEFLPGAKEAVNRIFSETDYYVIVVSNQSVIGRGWAEPVEVSNIFHRMKAELIGIEMGEWFDKKNDSVFFNRPLFFYFCPHAPDAGCACFKPSPGMIYKAAIEHDIDLSNSWMVGDSWTDIEAGSNAMMSKLIKIEGQSPLPVAFFQTGYTPDYIYFAKDLLQAVEFILNQEVV